MKAASIIAMRVAPWAIPVLIIGIFGIDLLTPLVWADWLLYFIPLVLSWQSHRVYTPYRLAGLVTLLMALGAYFHSDIDPLVAVLNRGFGIVAMWGFTWLMVRQKGVTDQLGKIELARSHAETHRGAALASLELAEASARGAIQRESQTARQLLASSLRLDGIIQSAMDAIMTVDQDQKVVLFNQAAEQMFGCSVAEAIGQPLDRFLPARFRDAHHHHIQAFGQSGVTSRKMGQLGTVMGIRANGEEFPIEAAISHITVEGKKYYTVILRDITDRKGVEEELKRQHDFIDTVLETAGGLVAVLDRHGAIQRFNRACEQTTGYSSEEVTGKAVWDFLLIPEEVESVKRVFSRLAGGESRNEHENDWVTKGGLRRRIAWTDTVITDGQGNVDYVVATGIDVTELKQVQEQLRKTERVAELGTLASGMAHEIGTPMNVILGRAEFLMDRVTEEPVKKGLRTIVTQVERITRVMNQLLAFARRKPPERGPLDLGVVIDDSLEMFHERLASSRVQVEWRGDPACPKVQADPDQMSQVIINLIMNALHAMPDGGTLRIGLAPEKDRVKLTVADMGHGIPQEAIGKIFEPFFTTKEFGKGTGLGLTVVKGIIEEHEGSIAVESEPGKGTTFTILLPKSV